MQIKFSAPSDCIKSTNIQCIWQDFGCKLFKNVLVSALIFSAFSQILTVVLKSSLVHLVIETNALIFSVSSQILAALLGSSLSHLEIGTNALKFIIWGNIIFKKFLVYLGICTNIQCMWLYFGSLITIQFIAPSDSNKCTNIQCFWQDFGSLIKIQFVAPKD